MNLIERPSWLLVELRRPSWLKEKQNDRLNYFVHQNDHLDYFEIVTTFLIFRWKIGTVLKFTLKVKESSHHETKARTNNFDCSPSTTPQLHNWNSFWNRASKVVKSCRNTLTPRVSFVLRSNTKMMLELKTVHWTFFPLNMKSLDGVLTYSTQHFQII